MDTVGLDLLGLHEQAIQRTRRVVAGLRDQHWEIWMDTARTDVRRLVNHLAVESRWVELLLAGQSMEDAKQRVPTNTDLLGEDPLGGYDRATTSADQAFRSPGALDVECQTPPSGETHSGRDYAGTRFVDILTHGWEIAKVTGQDTRLDPELTAAAYTVISPQINELFEKGIIAKPLETPVGAGPQARFLALFGFAD